VETPLPFAAIGFEIFLPHNAQFGTPTSYPVRYPLTVDYFGNRRGPWLD
jgi:hypothetical protein